MMSEMVFALSRAEGPFDDNHCFSTFLFAHLVHMSSTIEQKVINDGKNSKGGRVPSQIKFSTQLLVMCISYNR